MTQIRVAQNIDKSEFYRLWKICFGDSDAFCNWFFDNRFSAEHSVVLESENSIVSCMQAFPYPLRIRGRVVPAAMLCGVSTLPEQRKKGYMGKVFSFEMNLLREKGYLVAPHTPAILPSYFSYGHFPVADASYLVSECVQSETFGIQLKEVHENDWPTLFPLYTRFSEKYSGIIVRSEKDFLRKAADYASDGGRCAAYIKNNQIKGYAFYYHTEEEILCIEAVAEEGYYHYLVKGLIDLAEGRRVTAKLPPDLFLHIPSVSMVRKQKGVMGLCNLDTLLKELRLDIPYCFKVVDPVIPEHNGIFHFQGSIAGEEPVFEISAGHLLQVLVGYHSLEDLRKEISVFDEEKFMKINFLLPKQKCYIIDEY